MSRFQYSAITDSGRRVTGTVHCRDSAEATRRLLERGCHPVSVEAVDNRRQTPSQIVGIKAFYRFLFQRIRVADLAIMTRQMAALLKAGLPVLQTLDTLGRQSGHRQLARVLEDLEDTIRRESTTLAEAMDRHPDAFSPVYRGLVRCGEESDNLEEVLDNLASHLSRSGGATVEEIETSRRRSYWGGSYCIY